MGVRLLPSLSTCAHTPARHVHTYAGVCAPVAGREGAGECGRPAQGTAQHICCCLPACQPLPPPPGPPTSWGHLVLLRLHETGPGPRPGPGRAASLPPLPGDCLRADMAPGPPGTESPLSLNPPSALCQPSFSSRCHGSHSFRGSLPQAAFFQVPSRPQLLNILKQIFNSVTGRFLIVFGRTIFPTVVVQSLSRV